MTLSETTLSEYVTLQNAIEEFIALIDNNDFRAIIVRNENGDYFTQTTKTIFQGDTRVYGWGSFVNSSTERSIPAIAKHIKTIEKREGLMYKTMNDHELINACSIWSEEHRDAHVAEINQRMIAINIELQSANDDIEAAKILARYSDFEDTLERLARPDIA